MRDGSFTESFRHASAAGTADAFVVNSLLCFITRAAGRQVEKLVTLTGTGAEVVEDLFTIAGSVKIFSVFGVFEDVTNVADIDDVHLEVFDGANSLDITLATAPNCSTAALGSLIAKVDDSTAALAFLNASQVRIEETTKQAILDPVLVTAKSGATNYLRMKYDNTDTNLNCQIRWYVEYRTICGAGAMAPV